MTARTRIRSRLSGRWPAAGRRIEALQQHGAELLRVRAATPRSVDLELAQELLGR